MSRTRSVAETDTWSKWTRIDFERARRSFEAAARGEGQDPHVPEIAWLTEHIQAVCEARGRHAARHYARYVDHYLRMHGSPNLITTNRIQGILYAPDDFDVLSLTLEPISGPIKWRRAQDYADESYTPQYARACRRFARKWHDHCASAGTDPRNPQPGSIENWLATIGETKAPRTVRNAKNALSHYFRINGVADFTKAKSVQFLIEGMIRERTAPPVTPCTPKERRAMLAGLERGGVGIRDRVAVLLTAFTRWGVETLSLIDVEDCRIDATGVFVKSPVCEEVLYIGRHEVDDLAVATWLARLVEIVGTGPLFRSVDSRLLIFSEKRLSAQHLNTAIRKAAVRAGVRGEAISERLRALFDLEKREMASETVVTRYDGLEKPRLNRSEARRAAKHLIRKRRIEIRR